MRDDVFVIGVSMTEFGVFPDRSVPAMTTQVVREALADAGLDASRVGAAYFGNTGQGLLEGQTMIAGQLALREAGLSGIPVVNVENACATGSTAFSLAVTAVLAGTAEIALAVGVERMNIGDRARTMSLFDGASDVHRPDLLQQELIDLGGDVDLDRVGTRSPFMDVYAAFARAHMKAYGTTQEQLAAVAAKNHRHAVHNERAHFRKDMTVEEILTARPLAPPLTVPMCAPLTDGAAATLVCTPGVARRLDRKGVRVRSSVIGTGVRRDLHDYSRHVTRRTATRAFDQAGVCPEEVSVAEVHDATAFGEVLVSEMLGLVGEGQGGPAAVRGETTLSGRIPINPSGGLESKGHPLGATGLGQIYEIVTQLRGEAGVRQVPGARIGVVENGGGYQHGEEAVAVVAVLEG
ncbi:thiolase family protein [Saccharopolyspora sp. 5N708]|uniref:thiolase family protein n=1 Tax=Saccharopolyspora sp. 5N708 TaxID=3457424 RepID=UPI003FD51CF2